MAYGFYFDAESCIGCHTCQVACKDTHDLPIGTNYRIVRSFCTGEGFSPRWYNVSLPQAGCDFCAGIQKYGERPACESSCPMRAIEWGDLDELRAKHAGEPLADFVPAITEGDYAQPQFMRIKDCMTDPDFDEFFV